MTFRVDFKALQEAQVRYHPDHAYYDSQPADIRFPMYQAIWSVSEQICQDCHTRGAGYLSWIAEREDPDTPTYWISLCDECVAKTNRTLPSGA